MKEELEKGISEEFQVSGLGKRRSPETCLLIYLRPRSCEQDANLPLAYRPGFQKDGGAREVNASHRGVGNECARGCNGLSGARLSLVSRAERWSAVFSSRESPVTAANTACNADSVTPALQKRYGPELAVIEGGKP